MAGWLHEFQEELSEAAKIWDEMFASAARVNAAIERSEAGVEASVEAETVVEEEKTAVSEVEENDGRDVLGRQYSEKDYGRITADISAEENCRKMI